MLSENFSNPAVAAVYVGGLIVVVLFILVKFFGGKWLASLEETLKSYKETTDATSTKFDEATKELFNILTVMKQDLSNLKTDTQIQTMYIREIETRVNDRLLYVEKRIDKEAITSAAIAASLAGVEKAVDTIIMFHQKNHPTDRINANLK